MATKLKLDLKDAANLKRLKDAWRKIKACCVSGQKANDERVNHTFSAKWKLFEGFQKDFPEIPEGMTVIRKDTDRPWNAKNCEIGEGQIEAFAKVKRKKKPEKLPPEPKVNHALTDDSVLIGIYEKYAKK